MLHYNQWKEKLSDVAEVTILLELIIVLEKKEKHIKQGKIKIAFDDRKGHIKIVNQIYNVNTCAQ